jgi:uncharacterized protein
MAKWKYYDVQVYPLKDPKYFYTFELDNAFFALFEEPIVEIGQLIADVSVINSISTVRIAFTLKGVVELTCDRSLRPFSFPVEIEEQLFIRFGDAFAENDEHTFTLPHGTMQFNMAQHLYDFIGLSLPMRKLHPDLQAEEKEGQEISLLYSTLNSEESEGEQEKPDEPVDPRWEALKKLKKKE